MISLLGCSFSDKNVLQNIGPARKKDSDSRYRLVQDYPFYKDHTNILFPYLICCIYLRNLFCHVAKVS